MTFRETFLSKEHSLLLKIEFKAPGEGQDHLVHTLFTSVSELLCLKLIMRVQERQHASFSVFKPANLMKGFKICI